MIGVSSYSRHYFHSNSQKRLAHTTNHKSIWVGQIIGYLPENITLKSI